MSYGTDPLFSSKVSSKCPAVTFAVKRTASVSGRIRLLIVSMITINGINTLRTGDADLRF